VTLAGHGSKSSKGSRHDWVLDGWFDQSSKDWSLTPAFRNPRVALTPPEPGRGQENACQKGCKGHKFRNPLSFRTNDPIYRVREVFDHAPGH
jgi:hypothetical protein